MKKLDKILQELIEADPKLADHKDQLRQLLKELLKRKPDASMDPEFKARLREAVWARIEEAEGAAASGAKFAMFSIDGLWQKLAFAGVGALVAAIVFVPFLMGGSDLATESPMVKTSSSFSIEEVEDGAFGELSSEASVDRSESDEAGIGGGGVLSTTEGEDESIEAAASIYDYDYTYSSPTYSYVGDEFSFEESSVSVLKRSVSSLASSQIGSLVSGLDLGLIDLSQLEDLEIAYLQLSPADDEGYSAYVDFNNNEVSISYYDPDMWLYYEWTALTEADMLSHERMIDIANDFASDYGISLENYGEPEVEDYEDYYGYYPEYMEVTYPLLLDGKEVYTEWGGKYGLYFSIDIVNERVYYVSGLKAQNFQSSSYDAASYDEVLAYALDGGLNGYWDYWGNDDVEIQLGTPEAAYVQVYKYDDWDYYDLFVPAYVFPVMNEVEEFYRDYVVVPLAADLMQGEDIYLLEEAE